MRSLLVVALTIVLCIATTKCEDDKQIKLEDIERDTLLHETNGGRDGSDANVQKELAPSTQHIQLSYNNNPQDVFVTPTPGRYAVNVKDSPADLRQQVYHLPKVHEGEQTYSAPAKQTLLQPIIGGGQPIHPNMIPQPQYVYIPSAPQAHHPYVSQAHAYVMVPFVQQAPAQPTPTVYTYSHASHPTNPPPPPHHQPSYQAFKSIEYAIPSTPITPLQTAVDYKNIATIVPKNTLPSISSSFRQYYSPGLEYHYTEIVPTTKLSPASPSYAYHHAPTHNYHTSFISQPSPYQYYQQPHNGPYTNIFKQPTTSTGLLDSYIPSLVSYRQQQQYQPNHQYRNYYSAPMPQQQQPQLFTPAHSPSSSASHYASYPSPQAYNTIAYSVPLPPYDHHSKRSTKTSSTPSAVKAPKSS